MQWTLTLFFLGIAAVSAFRVVADRSLPVAAISHAAHLVMAVVMAAMVWPWWASVWVLPQLLFFWVAAAWFVALSVLLVTGR